MVRIIFSFPTQIADKKTRALKWIPCAADFKVQMWAGRIAGRAHGADDFALRNIVADVDIGGAEVAVQSLCAVVVFYNNVRTVAAVPAGVAGDDHLSVSRGHDRLADLVVGSGEVNGVVAVNALGFDTSCHWSLVIALDGWVILAIFSDGDGTNACGHAAAGAGGTATRRAGAGGAA